jgi:type VI secretion system protein ImpF
LLTAFDVNIFACLCLRCNCFKFNKRFCGDFLFFLMSRTDNEIRITPSVLDRLLDFEPDAKTESVKSHSKSLRELKLSVRRDLEWLLNTRQIFTEIPDTLIELNKSVFAFGLPDITGTSAKSTSEQKRLIKKIETAIKNFESRFLDVKVVFEPINNIDRTIKFKIEARLDIEPTPEPIVFDTVLQLGSGGFSLKES